MTLPSTGSISMSQVNIELAKASNARISMNDAAVRSLAGKASGTISFADLRGKSNITWSHPAGVILAEDYGSVSLVVSCNVAGTWSVSNLGGNTNYLSITRPSDNKSIHFSLRSILSGESYITTGASFNLSYTSSAGSRSWTVRMYANGY